MTIIDIDKSLYRKRLNIIIVGFIATLAILSLVYGSLLIYFFSVSSDQLPAGESNFKFNLVGVVLSLLTCAAILSKLKNHEFLKEVYYVWQLKQIHNSVYRKLKAINNAMADNDVDALIVLNYYYTSLKQVYQLDDNTITLSKVNKDHQQVIDKINETNLTISLSQFDKEIIAKF